MTTKYIFVTGGVASSLGKGITAASLGRLLRGRGLVVQVMKLDGYLQPDPDTLSPYEHGEVWVTPDGATSDLDLGHYERFLDVDLGRGSSVTMGQIYLAVIAKERRGEYQGKTVQVIPHVTNEIKDRVRRLGGDDVDIVIIEIGGTVGDIESVPFIEAARQLRREEGRHNVCFVHLTLVPYLSSSGEYKTKPTQHSVVELRRFGIQPDVIVCRCDVPLPPELKRKISLLCDVDEEAVVTAVNAKSIYAVPVLLREEDLDGVVAAALRLEGAERSDLSTWEDFLARLDAAEAVVKIGLVGKYVGLPDAYLSVLESLRHAGAACGARIEHTWIDAEELSPSSVKRRLAGLDGIIVPGGFGGRGIEGKIAAVRWTRENAVPTLGICLGLQVMVVECARDIAGLEAANSTEFAPETEHPVIDILADQEGVTDRGGTMRLGSYTAVLKADTAVRALYGAEVVTERHRHRYEVNPRYRARLAETGLVFSGLSPDETLVEYVELPGHPFWVGTQAHPEFRSRPERPHPLFLGLVRAALAQSESRRAAA